MITHITDRERAQAEVIEALVAGRDALAKRVEALEADAARYRFLEGDFSPMGLNIDGNHAWAYRRNAMLKGPSLSAAIDAAMKADQP